MAANQDLIKLLGAVSFRSTLSPLDWTVRAGQHWIVTGARATGKTLLAESLTGRRRLTAGTLEYPFLADSGYEVRRRALRLVTFMDNSRLAHGPNHVHYYQQRYNAFDASGHPTVRQYLEAGGYRVEMHGDLLDTFGIRDLLEREKIKLSSGQTRKVLLARELLRRPEVLIIDNPYVGLDAESRGILNDLLDRLVRTLGLTLILCGHLPAVPDSITHRLHLYADGSWWRGKADEVPPPDRTPRPDRTRLGRLAHHWARKGETAAGEEIIRFEGVTVDYGGPAILADLDWVVTAGEKWVVSGANGSGKSTLLSLVYADNPLAYANTIYLFGNQRGRGGSIWEIKRHIGFTSPELHTHFREAITAREVLLTGYSDTFTLPKRVPAEGEEVVDLLLDYFGLREIAERPFPELSSGTQRLLLLCRALVKAPPLLLLDEPFQGLDGIAIDRARLLLETVLQPHHTVVFISHYRPELPDGMNWNELKL